MKEIVEIDIHNIVVKDKSGELYICPSCENLISDTKWKESEKRKVCPFCLKKIIWKE